MNNEELRKKLDKQGEVWIGVDLDGTLAILDENTASGVIGKPIQVMVDRVKSMLARGERVKIFTGRAANPKEIPAIKIWLANAGLTSNLEITNKKDRLMLECWDDSCVLVERNTGKILARNK